MSVEKHATDVSHPMRRALFLDRDGVVNEEIGYLSRSEQVHFVPGIFGLCHRAQSLDYLVIIITNQSGIARGIYTEEDFHTLMRWMIGELARQDIYIAGYYFCPHHPEHGVGAYRVDCQDRKPNPGMLMQAAEKFHLDLSQSILIGDRCTDMLAGAAAGVGTLALLKGTEKKPCVAPTDARYIQSLHEALDLLTRS
ncbi:MAG TPA: HAD family hydrolase [Acidobacteriaceae bacterium]|nr:HAD family hydrolase [Acidobacteriaceae bacterium]